MNQKLKNKRREYMLLKGKLGLKSWVMETIVEAVCCRRGGDSLGMGCGFNSATNRLMFSFNFASDLPRFRRNFRHDRATIGSRSGVDRGVRASSITGRSMGNESAPIPRPNPLDRGLIAPRSRLDCSAIAARSRRDRGVLPQPLHAVRSSFR